MLSPILLTFALGSQCAQVAHANHDRCVSVCQGPARNIGCVWSCNERLQYQLELCDNECPRSWHCEEPLECWRAPGTRVNICTSTCRVDTDCPQGWTCYPTPGAELGDPDLAARVCAP